MAAIEELVISKVIEEGAFHEASKDGIKYFHFGGTFEDAWKWIAAYAAKHGSTPTRRAFSMQFGDMDLPDASGETFSGLFEELRQQYRSETLVKVIGEAWEKVEKDDADTASQILSEGLRRLSAGTTVLRDRDLVADWENRIQRYEALRGETNPMRGLHTGFHRLDEITKGYRPQQFILFVGEPKRGKSLFSLISAQAANGLSNQTVLYISFEMSIEEQEQRYDALYAKIGYDKLLSADLTTSEMEHLRQTLKERRYRNPFIVSEDTSRATTVSAIRSKALEYNPGLIVIDGMYMMEDDAGETDERKKLTAVTRDTKRMAQDLDIPVIGTTQVLPGKVQNKQRRIEANAIGYTSSFIQDADLILGVELDMEVPNQSIIRVVEARSSRKGDVIKVKWDWSTMDFSEDPHLADDDEEEEWYLE